MKIDLKQILNDDDIEIIKYLLDSYRRGTLSNTAIAYGDRKNPTYTEMPRIAFILMAVMNELSEEDK